MRSYLVNYRAGDRGRTAANRRIVIGRHGLVTPDQARCAREILGRVALGKNLAGDRARSRAIRETDSPHCRAHDNRRSVASHALSIARSLLATRELLGTAVSAPGFRASLLPRPIRPSSLNQIIHPGDHVAEVVGLRRPTGACFRMTVPFNVSRQFLI